jgi:hypothetical protein
MLSLIVIHRKNVSGCIVGISCLVTPVSLANYGVGLFDHQISDDLANGRRFSWKIGREVASHLPVGGSQRRRWFNRGA